MNNIVIKPGQTIGIVGGGQLGRMLALSAKASGFRIAVLENSEDCPCAQVADEVIIGTYNDKKALSRLIECSNVITFEFENIDYDALKWLEENAYVPQGAELLRITQNRITEKMAIEQAEIPVAPYTVIHTVEEIYDKIKKFGYPSVLKTARGGYDGKGQLVLRKDEDIQKANLLLVSGPCILESWVPFEKELSVIVTRKANGDTAVFPVAENIHQDNILHKTICPARISGKAQENAKQIAIKLAESFQLIGILAVEMFFINDDTIYINELAPRPHNSGHHTIEACKTSQFEQHIRAICNWKLGSTELLNPAVMVNILGEHQKSLIEKIEQFPDWKIHFYGKKEVKEKRKMGHATILRKTCAEALVEINKSGIWETAPEKIGGLT